MGPDDVVRTFHELMQARRWRDAAALLSPEVHIEYTATGERFDGPAFIAMNEAYPEGWQLEVVEVIAAGERAASQVAVTLDGVTDWCAGFYTVRDGLIVDGVEHWITQGGEPAPEWRGAYTTPS